MRNHGNHVASLCEVVRWLGEKAEGLGVNLFTGFPVDSLLVEGERVVGVRTAPTGLKRDGKPGPGHQPATDLSARVVALSEGSRGMLAQAWMKWAAVTSPNPQIYALGVKELWHVKRPLDAVIHTLGWPLPRDAFGGSFIYPMGPDQVAIGLVAGLDTPRQTFDVHRLLQRLKEHPLVRPMLEGGECLEWGAKTIPEGGWWSLPSRRQGRGVMLLGDAAGFVDVAAMKGVHHAMRSGIEAARAIVRAWKAKDERPEALASYDDAMAASESFAILKRRRNLRLAFKSGFFWGGFKASLMTLTLGAFPGWRIGTKTDADEPRRRETLEPFTPDGKRTFSKVDGVFRSGNKTRDDVPSHLIVGKDVPAEVADLYASLCPAGVYERRGDSLVVNAPNCVDCKATDVLGPRWTPREGGSGPHYLRM
jgi:electron-transferring-flavoprotein dehydrogenase